MMILNKVIVALLLISLSGCRMIGFMKHDAVVDAEVSIITDIPTPYSEIGEVVQVPQPTAFYNWEETRRVRAWSTGDISSPPNPPTRMEKECQ